MTELLTAAQMRAIEQAAIESGAVTGLDLMERAGQGVVDAMLEWRSDLAAAPHRVVVLCGPGNNGGDGFVVARLLQRRGWAVEVFLYGDEAKLAPDAAENARRWREMGPVHHWRPESVTEAYLACDVLVDALFGTGLSRPLDGALGKLVDEVWGGIGHRAAGRLHVAVDMPSGICADSGRVLGAAAPADLTVTFHRQKLGHHLSRGLAASGAVRTVDIGLRGTSSDDCARAAQCAASVTRQASPQAHKYEYGHALVLSGGPGKGGAARLAARGALRIGAGLVTVGCPHEALTENAARLEAIMLAEIGDVEALAAELAARKIKAVCIGPGFGTGERLRRFIACLLDGARGAHPTMVLDADALSAYRDDPETLFAMLHGGCVLTPHEGEFGRLFPDILAKLTEAATRGPAYSKVDATREAAARAGCTVLFKGPDTVVADPHGPAAVNSAHSGRAVPWLATAGSGDVLAGFITGLLARGVAPIEAAESAAWLHVECARSFGPGLIAEDIPEELPKVLRALGPT